LLPVGHKYYSITVRRVWATELHDKRLGEWFGSLGHCSFAADSIVGVGGREEINCNIIVKRERTGNPNDNGRWWWDLSCRFKCWDHIFVRERKMFVQGHMSLLRDHKFG